MLAEKKINCFGQMSVGDADPFVPTLHHANWMLDFNAEKIRVAMQWFFIVTVSEDNRRLKSCKHVKNLFASDIPEVHEPGCDAL